MKKAIVKPLLLAIFIVLAFTACDDSDDNAYIVDFYPIDVYIHVTDAKGANLLDPTVPNNILDNGIQMIYNNERYDLDKEFDPLQPITRYYLPYFYGLSLIKNMKNILLLYIGEFDGAEDCVKRSFVIEWGDGTKSEIAYSNKAFENGIHTRVERSFYLDGKEVENPITIVK